MFHRETSAQSRLFHTNFHAIEQSAEPFLIAEILIRFIRVQFMINSAVRHLATMYERSSLLYVRNYRMTQKTGTLEKPNKN